MKNFLKAMVVVMMVAMVFSFRTEARTKVVPIGGTATVKVKSAKSDKIKWCVSKKNTLGKLSKKITSKKAGTINVSAKANGKKLKLNYDKLKFEKISNFGSIKDVNLKEGKNTYKLKWKTSQKIDPEDVKWVNSQAGECGIEIEEISKDGKTATVSWDGTEGVLAAIRVYYCGRCVDMTSLYYD